MALIFFWLVDASIYTLYIGANTMCNDVTHLQNKQNNNKPGLGL